MCVSRKFVARFDGVLKMEIFCCYWSNNVFLFRLRKSLNMSEVLFVKWISMGWGGRGKRISKSYSSLKDQFTKLAYLPFGIKDLQPILERRIFLQQPSRWNFSAILLLSFPLLFWSSSFLRHESAIVELLLLFWGFQNGSTVLVSVRFFEPSCLEQFDVGDINHTIRSV